MKSLFHKYERTLKNQNILNKNTKSVVLEYLRCDKCKKIPFIEVPDIECLNCFFSSIYKMMRKINEGDERDGDRKSVFETINTVRKMMISSLNNLTDYIECVRALELSGDHDDDMIIFWSGLIMDHIKEKNKVPNGDELEDIIYSW